MGRGVDSGVSQGGQLPGVQGLPLNRGSRRIVLVEGEDWSCGVGRARGVLDAAGGRVGARAGEGGRVLPAVRHHAVSARGLGELAGGDLSKGHGRAPELAQLLSGLEPCWVRGRRLLQAGGRARPVERSGGGAA